MTSILKAEGLNHSCIVGKDTFEILKDININVNEGEFISIVGRSGSGKSILLNLISGFIIPRKGSINILGAEITGMSESKRAIFRQNNIGFMFQSYNLFRNMTVFENIGFPLELMGRAKKVRKSRVKEVLQLLELENKEMLFPSQLTDEEQQKVALGRVIVTDPKIILADEPTGNLDSDSGKKIMKYICEINRRFKITIIMVTRHMELALYADRIMQISDV